MPVDTQQTIIPLLKAEGIRKSYAGVPALYDGSIDLRAGSVHALCGGNGAGKSTFLNILMGLESPDGGRVWLNGRDLGFYVVQEGFTKDMGHELVDFLGRVFERTAERWPVL